MSPRHLRWGHHRLSRDLATDGTPAEPTGGAATLSFAASITIGQTDALPSLSFDEGTSLGFQYASSTAVEDGVHCPGAGQIACVAFGENGTGAEAEWMSSATGEWAAPATPGEHPEQDQVVRLCRHHALRRGRLRARRSHRVEPDDGFCTHGRRTDAPARRLDHPADEGDLSGCGDLRRHR